MEPFVRIDSIAAPLEGRNLDTNQLCPTRFNKVPIGDPDYPRILFHNQRFADDGTEIPDFVLNREPFRRAGILVGDENFGCGSSRESAVYALLAFGIRCVVAPSFGDIFHANCTKNGLLPAVLPKEVCERVRAALRARPGARLAVDLKAQTVSGPEEGGSAPLRRASDHPPVLAGGAGRCRPHDAVRERHRGVRGRPPRADAVGLRERPVSDPPRGAAPDAGPEGATAPMPASSPAIAERYAERFAGLEIEDLPAAVAEVVVSDLIDVAGLCIAARNTDYVRAAPAIVRRRWALYTHSDMSGGWGRRKLRSSTGPPRTERISTTPWRGRPPIAGRW